MCLMLAETAEAAGEQHAGNVDATSRERRRRWQYMPANKCDGTLTYEPSVQQATTRSKAPDSFTLNPCE